jgi:hypothetical protein
MGNGGNGSAIDDPIADGKFGLRHSFTQRNHFRHLSTKHHVREQTITRFQVWNTFRT